MIRVLLVVAVLAKLARAQPAESADTIVVRAKQNDSVSMLASEYYGDRNKFPYIVAENRMRPPRPLTQGQRLRIPVIREITTSPGDTFRSLAEILLGDPRRGPFLADANQLSANASLAAGTPLLVPFTITHTADNKESLALIAATYYNDPKLADLLRVYNFLDKTVLEKGEAITVPSMHVKVHPGKLPPPDAESRARRERRRDNTKLAVVAVPIARHAWRVGNYSVVKKQLVEIDVAFLELATAVEVGVLFGSAQVAIGDLEGAQRTFQRVIDRKPGHKLRKVDHSPKVLAVWAKVDGKVE